MTRNEVENSDIKDKLGFGRGRVGVFNLVRALVNKWRQAMFEKAFALVWGIR